jgi:hypothetical protein
MYLVNAMPDIFFVVSTLIQYLVEAKAVLVIKIGVLVSP